MEKTYKTILADSLFIDLEAIPAKCLTKILDKIELLETFPKLGFALEKEKWIGYREFIVDPYKVLYTVEEDKKTVTIHFAKHGKMDFQ